MKGSLSRISYPDSASSTEDVIGIKEVLEIFLPVNFLSKLLRLVMAKWSFVNHWSWSWKRVCYSKLFDTVLAGGIWWPKVWRAVQLESTSWTASLWLPTVQSWVDSFCLASCDCDVGVVSGRLHPSSCDCDSSYVHSDSQRGRRVDVLAEQECLCPIVNPQ